MAELKESWYAIVNSRAGSGKTLSQWREAEAMLFAKGINYRFVMPDSEQEARSRINAACGNGYRRFIAVGGDGTVHNLFKSLVEYSLADRNVPLDDFKVAVLPIGSGNDWLRSRNIPRDPERIIALIAENSFEPQDIAKVETFDAKSGEVNATAYMANIGGYAFDANVCDNVNFQKSNGIKGKLIYFKALCKMAFKQKPHGVTVLVDGKVFFKGELYTMSVGNGRFSGGGLCQTPSAKMNDGLLNIMLAPVFPMRKIFRGIYLLLKGRIEDVDFLYFTSGKTIEVIPDSQGQLVEVDGDILGRAPVRFSIMPEKINAVYGQE